MDQYPIREVLALVRSAPSAAAGWPRLRAVCARRWPSPLWARLGAGVDPTGDVRAAAAWLDSQLAAGDAPSPVRGVYLGLDTLNMSGRGGTNVEIGATGAADPSRADIEWTYELEWYGRSHLIAGLKAMHREYSRSRWEELFSAADYVLFLGYSGLVLAEAAGAVRWEASALVVWGFHDGDLFRLGRAGGTGFKRLARA